MSFPALAAAALALASPAPMPAGAALEEAIAARDAAFFATFFDRCAPDALAAMLDPEYRMLHDLDGVVAGSAEAFVSLYAERCAGYADPDPERFQVARAHVPGSRIVRPIAGWGALEEGSHVFLERRGPGPQRIVGGARYMHLWRWTGADFRLVQSLSYDHEGARD